MTGYIYILRFNGSNNYKIGKAIDADRRIKQHKTTSMFAFTVVKVFKTANHDQVERLIHSDLASYRVRGENVGLEIFSLPSEDFAIKSVSKRLIDNDERSPEYTDDQLRFIIEDERATLMACGLIPVDPPEKKLQDRKLELDSQIRLLENKIETSVSSVNSGVIGGIILSVVLFAIALTFSSMFAGVLSAITFAFTLFVVAVTSMDGGEMDSDKIKLKHLRIERDNLIKKISSL